MSDETQKPLAIMADDEQDIRRVARLALEREGWRVIEAENGRESWRLVRENSPSLVIMDLMMPQMSGVEVCRKIAEDANLRNAPVLLISGVNERAKILEDFWDLPLRYKNFLHKPFSPEELLAAVRGILPPTGMKFSPTASAKPEAPPVPAPTAHSSPAPPPPEARPTSSGLRPTGPVPTPSPHTGGYRILTVDDEPDLCMIMKVVLGQYHQVEEAHNGMEALARIDEFCPDFVILDINMPLMGGLETAEAIRRHPTMCRVPIFFLTAETATDLPRKAFDVGGNLYLRKPLDPERLLKFIDHFLKETGLKPGQHLQAAPRPQAKPTATSGPQAVRILTVDFNIEDQQLLKRLLGEGGQASRVSGGPFEPFWTEDPHTALGNLERWQPDLLLYNPRNPGMDGVAFGQTLQLRKTTGDMEVVFIGTRFYEIDRNYSARHFHRDVIALDADHDLILKRLDEAVGAARKHLRPKRFTMQQLHDEEVERLRRLSASGARQARERETFRQRYSSIQSFIDRQFID